MTKWTSVKFMAEMKRQFPRLKEPAVENRNFTPNLFCSLGGQAVPASLVYDLGTDRRVKVDVDGVGFTVGKVDAKAARPKIYLKLEYNISKFFPLKRGVPFVVGKRSPDSASMKEILPPGFPDNAFAVTHTKGRCILLQNLGVERTSAALDFISDPVFNENQTVIGDIINQNANDLWGFWQNSQKMIEKSRMAFALFKVSQPAAGAGSAAGKNAVIAVPVEFGYVKPALRFSIEGKFLGFANKAGERHDYVDGFLGFDQWGGEFCLIRGGGNAVLVKHIKSVVEGTFTVLKLDYMVKHPEPSKN